MAAAPDSSVAGYLAPLDSLADDADLDLLFQPVIAGISGLPGNLVRRSGQAVPGPQPDRATTWCGFSTATTQADTNPTLVHDGNAAAGQGVTYELRSETLEIRARFYGPAAIGTAKRLRDGFGISQNREAMRTQGLAYVACDPIVFVPDDQNGQVIRRADVVFRVRRMAVRAYAIRNIESVEGLVVADSGSPSGPAVVLSPFETEV